MKPKTYNLLMHCIETGVSRGLHRSRKHDPHPSDQAIEDSIVNAVSNEICEWFEFDELKDS